MFDNNNNGLTLTYDRNELLEKIKANRDRHIKEYEQAMEVYKKEGEKALKKLLREFRANPRKRLEINLRRPRQFTKQYDEAIEMLQMTTEETIKLPRAYFNQLVRDEWSWSDEFASHTAIYNNKR